MTNNEIKDKILAYCLEKPDKNISASTIIKNIAPDKTEEEIEFLYKSMLNESDPVAEITISKYTCIIKANGFTKPFLDTGGFTKLESNINKAKEKAQHKEEVDLELAQSNINANKFNKNSTRINIFLTILNVILSLLVIYLTFWK
jgi:hypothetical protein